MLDTKNLNWRNVITPDGEGELIGLDDKDNPKHGVVLVSIDGLKLKCARNYTVEEMEEMEEK